jgi:peroxiredoxin
MPKVQVLHEKYEDDPKIAILAMNVGDDNEKMKTWWAEKKYTFPTLNDADDLSKKYGIKAFPSTIVIGPEGTVLLAKVGSPSSFESEIQEAVDALN